MKNDNKNIVRIAKSIRNQAELERKNRGQRTAVARFDVDMTAQNGQKITHLWLASQNYQPQINNSFELKEEGSQYFHKNSKVGVILTSQKFGTYTYKAPDMYSKRVLVDRQLTFTSKATYNSGCAIRDLYIKVQGEDSFRVASLSELLSQIEEIENQIQEKKRAKEERERISQLLEEEQRERGAALLLSKVKQEEQLRKEQERVLEELRIQEELRRREEEEIRQLEEKSRLAYEQLQQSNSSFRFGRELRYQEIIDESQTLAKISHLYDGVPIVIEGGPGTGKTTTSIQRLKFLIDPNLKEHESCALSKQQIEMLTDISKVTSHWIFISPSDLLAQYLKSALSAEGLANGHKNVTPYENFLIKRLQDYCITLSTTNNKPLFRPIKSDNALSKKTLIINGEKAVKDFESFIVRQLAKPLYKALTIDTTGFVWRPYAISIQADCKDIETVSSLLDIIRLYERLNQNHRQHIKQFTDKLKSLVEILANHLRKIIMADPETVEYLELLFNEWDNGGVISEPEEIEESDEEESIPNLEDVNSRVYQSLKLLLPKIGLRQYDKSLEFSKHQKEFYDVVRDYIVGVDLQDIALYAWFKHNFSSLCSGYESKVFKHIIKLYKLFRREQIKVEDSPYNTDLLKVIVSSKESLHRDEQALLLGFINNMIAAIIKWSPLQFNSLKHPYVAAYKKSIKYVIGVDEASDYSELDYYCISSFAHYDFSAITLCGDIMQGLGNDGIKSWESLKKWVFPKLDVYTLRKSYRQWPTLLEVSRRMYKDDQKEDAPYISALPPQKHEALPLAYVSTNENLKVNWIAERIFEVYSRFQELPSIAIFINEEEDVDEFLNLLRDNELMTPFFIEDCTHGNQGREDSIRVFHLSTVKGMEFEAVFFHNIDCAKIEDCNLLSRYIYVGISRAVSHLGATFISADNNVIKYFEIGKNWTI